MIKKILYMVFNKALTFNKAEAMMKAGLPSDQVKTTLGVLVGFFGVVNYVPEEGKEKVGMLTNLIKTAKATIAAVTAAIQQAPKDIEALKAKIWAIVEQRQAAIQKVADRRKQAVADKGAEVTARVVTEYWDKLGALKDQLSGANDQLTTATNQLEEVKEVVRLFS